MHFQHSLGAILSHSGQDYSQGVGTTKSSDGIKQDIDSRSLVTDERAGFNVDIIPGATATHNHMIIPRSKQCMTWEHCISILSLLHIDSTQAIESFGKAGGKIRGHMLNNHDSRRRRRQLYQHLFQCFGTTG